MKKRVGIVGFGHLGKYLTNAILESSDLELAFVWNRTEELVRGNVDDRLICRDLNSFSKFEADLIVEVSHPIITHKFGELFVEECDLMVGSPTALAKHATEKSLRKAAHTHGLYVPAGALWGGEDIAKMAERNTLKELKVTMKKHPSCFKLESPLKEVNEGVASSAVTLYDGPVRDLCPLAPNNVNTMAAAAMAAHNLGFENVQGCLISDPGLMDWHIVEIELVGPSVNGFSFSVTTSRKNPADPGAVTGSATYASFFSSLMKAHGKGPGVHIC